MLEMERQLVVEVVIEGEPASKQRPRFALTKGGKVYTPRDTKEAESVVASEIKKAYPRIQANERDAFRVELEFFLKSHQRRDLDNMTKLVFDACNKFVWKDDAQVEELEARLTRASAQSKTIIRIYSFPSSVPYINCAECGKEKRIYPSWKWRQYCSRGCMSRAWKSREMVACAHCGTEKEFKQYKLKGRKRQVYCSEQCHHLATTIELQCLQCERRYRKPQSQVKVRRHYCSEDCLRTYWRNHRKKSAAGVCADCGGATTKKTYQRCRACTIGTFRNNLGA